MAGDARAGVGELLRLGARLGGSLMQGSERADPAGVTCRWARELMEREGAQGLELGLGGRTFRVLGDATRSETVLGADPAAGGWVVSDVKTDAMGFLAPGSLVVADGPVWTRLRAVNERVLADGGPHPSASAILAHVRRAFERPVEDLGDVRAAMGRAMVGIVLGGAPPGADPARDVSVLFDLVQSPVKRKLTGFLHRGRRKRLFRLLERSWDGARPGDGTLIGLARAHAEEASLERDEVIQQVPHWMFTFTRSGADLLARTLALVTARPGVRERVLAELGGAGPSDAPATVEGLPYLNACIQEAGRLFPPVTRTFHRSTKHPPAIPGDVIHWFPLLQRADALGPTVHDFRPERWLEATPDPVAAASNLFLRGPRRCPGMGLILFVCRAALARQIGELGTVVRSPSRLARDPLPVSFPAGAARFSSRRTS